MHLMVELLRVGQMEVKSHVGVVSHTHEVEVPGPLRWDHEEAQEPIREQHLDPLVVGGHVSLGVVALVCVLPAPVITTGSQLVGRQGAGSGCEAGRDDDSLLSIPHRIISHDLSMSGDVLR